MEIKFKRGETFSQKFIFKKGETNVDLTDYQIMFTLKKNIKDLDIEDTKAEIKKNLTKLELGTARLDLTEDDTFLKGGDYYFDIKLRKSEGAWVRNLVGDCKISDVATNRK